ncbi:hypothetical protein [Streptomyces sp. A012304]|uniref:hypothetical protein n=1 Tax=Streptomyces sp. A012304 TaxID=375446 RepID=UPI00222EEF4D|nr:hypothetical protein [Streptomyces sp. A012304]GKQ39094.1 hypothetical protein ALMP_56230 [Streptomyces sp. A012304]
MSGLGETAHLTETDTSASRLGPSDLWAPAETGEPEEPLSPDTPTGFEPTDPTEPEPPQEPMEPGGLEEPDEPGGPEEPEEPEAQAVPLEPETPAEPEEAAEPERPETPEQSAEVDWSEVTVSDEDSGISEPEEPVEPDSWPYGDEHEEEAEAQAEPAPADGSSEPAAPDAEPAARVGESAEEPAQDDQVDSQDDPVATDAPEKIEAVIDRPSIDHMYDRPFYEPVQYGDPINFGDKPTPLFDGPPVREQTQQGALYDCTVIATLGAVAGHRPEVISNSIRENGDGTYTVSLHETVRGDDGVARPTGRQIELSLTPDLPAPTARPGESALAATQGTAWCALLEKAVAGVDQTWGDDRRGQWEDRWAIEKGAAGFPEGPIPEGYERLNRGAWPLDQSELLTQLTGEESALYVFPTGDDAQDRVKHHIEHQLAEGKPVLVGTRALDAEAGEFELPKKLYGAHAYEVVAVDGDMLHLRNPWNEQHPDELTMDEFFHACQNDKQRGGYTTLL